MARTRPTAPSAALRPVVLLLLSCYGTSTLMADDTQTPEKIVTIEGITEYRLENGLQVLLFPDASQSSVTVNLTVLVGSRHEGYGEAGMAHLLEHMLFKGCPKFPNVPKALQERGAQFNGTTWLDRTNYYETLPANDENLEFALELEADRLVNSFVKAEDLASEMTVVRNEFEAGENSPHRVLSQRITSAAYEWHNYGRSTIGNRSDIERVPITKLRDFYRRHYQPDNATLVVAGRFDPATALRLIAKHFGPIPRPERELDRTYTIEPAQDGERRVVLRRVGDVALVGAAYHIPAGPHPEFAAIRVLTYVLADEPAGLLYKGLVETNMAANVYGYALALHDPGLLMLGAEVRKDGSVDEVLAKMLDIAGEGAEKGFDPADVERAKQRILKQRELSLTNTRAVAIELSEWAAQGDWRLFFLFRDRIEAVTPEEVQAVAAKYLVRHNRTIGLFLPTKESLRAEVPATPSVAEMVHGYEGREALAEGEEFDSSPANVEARTTRDDWSGLRVAFLPKKTRGEAVQLRLTLRYGTAESLRGLRTAAELLPEMMTRGAGDLNHQQIQDELSRLRATLNAAGEPGEASFSLQTKRPQLPEVLRLLGRVLREPSLPAAELEVLRRQVLAELEQSATDPQALGINLLRRKVSPYPAEDPRATPAIEEQIAAYQKVTVDDLRKLYDRFLGGAAGELAVVGDFDPAEVEEILRPLLTDWRSEQPYARLEQKYFEVKPGSDTIDTPDKANATYFAATIFPLSQAHADYPALEIGNFILGGGSLSSRLGDRVRQQEGLSYGVYSGLSVQPLDDRTSLTIMAIANPANIPKVDEVIREELERLLRDGITEEELAQAKSGYLQQQQVRRTSDSALSSLLNHTAFTGRDMKFYEALETAVAGLTREQVEAALRRHVDSKNLSVVKAGDFSAKPAE